MIIVSSIVILTSLMKSRITLPEGIITLALSNVFVIMLWTISVNLIIDDQYLTYHKIESIESEIYTDIKTKNCDCEGYTCNKCEYSEYKYTWYVYSANDRFPIRQMTSASNDLETPEDIINTYERGKIFVDYTDYRNIYNNMGQYKHSNFEFDKDTSIFFINATTNKKYEKMIMNNELFDIALDKNINPYIVLTDVNTSTKSILDKWNGIQLNDVLIHLTLNDSGVVNLANIKTWGNGKENSTFIRVMTDKLSYIDISDNDQVISVLSKSLDMFELPDDQMFNAYIQYIKPSVWVILLIIISSLLFTFSLLYTMYHFNRDEL